MEEDSSRIASVSPPRLPMLESEEADLPPPGYQDEGSDGRRHLGERPRNHSFSSNHSPPSPTEPSTKTEGEALTRH